MKVKEYLSFMVRGTTITICHITGDCDHHILCKDDYDKEVALFVPTGELKGNLIVE